jgi:hypothetical protein
MPLPGIELWPSSLQPVAIPSHPGSQSVPEEIMYEISLNGVMTVLASLQMEVLKYFYVV